MEDTGNIFRLMSEADIACLARFVKEGHVVSYNDSRTVRFSTETRVLCGEVHLFFPNGEYIELWNTLKEDLTVFMKIESWERTP